MFGHFEAAYFWKHHPGQALTAITKTGGNMENRI